MRQIASLPNEAHAERFIDFLKTLDVPAQCEEDEGQWLIWIREENHLDTAREELEKFRADPDAEVYREARAKAAQIRSEEAQRRELARKNMHVVREGWNAPLQRRAPIVFGLIIGCIAVVVLGGGFHSGAVMPIGEEVPMIERYLTFADYSDPGFLATEDTFYNIKKGQLWRFFTPAFLHGNLPHIVFNLYWIYLFGGQIEPKVGRFKFVLLTLTVMGFSALLQAIMIGPNFLGISGVVSGYFGYILVRRNQDGYRLSEFLIVVMLVFYALDFTPYRMVHNVAAFAHAGGLVAGIAMGYLLPQLPTRQAGPPNRTT